MPDSKLPTRRRGRAATPPAKTTTKLSITHDRLTLVVSFASGDVLRVSLTRSGERLTLSGPAAQGGLRSYLRAVADGLKRRGGENNQQRFERVARVAGGVADLPGLVAALAVCPADPAPPADW